MDAFGQCVEDLGTIGRMLELPHGRDIAVQMLRELAPYLKELEVLKERDPTGAVRLILDYVEQLRTRLKVPDPVVPLPGFADRVA